MDNTQAILNVLTDQRNAALNELVMAKANNLIQSQRLSALIQFISTEGKVETECSMSGVSNSSWELVIKQFPDVLEWAK